MSDRAYADQASTASAASLALPTPEQLFAATKAQFGAIYRSIRSMDLDAANEQVFATVALRHFEATEAGVSNGALGQDAFNDSGKVYLLACNILEVMQGVEALDADLLRAEQGDGPFLGMLRSLLKSLGNASPPD